LSKAQKATLTTRILRLASFEAENYSLTINPSERLVGKHSERLV